MSQYIKLDDVQKMLDNFALNLTKWEFSLLVLHIKNDINSLPSINQDDIISKKLALEFADWYHNGLLNSERKDIEEEFKKFCVVKFILFNS